MIFKKREKITNIIFDDCDEFDENSKNQQVTVENTLIKFIKTKSKFNF